MRGLEHLPTDKPIIFVSNHPIGFLEPLILATYIPKSLYYLARGDFFKKPIFRWMLNQIHIHPIYRFRDGFSDMRNNQDAIQTALDFIYDGKSFLIFGEGSTKLQRSIRPIQKGVSRIIYDGLSQKPDLDIAIMGVGFNVSHSHQLRSDVIVSISNVINPKELFEKEPSKPRFLKLLTKEIETQMQGLVPHLEDVKDEELLESLIQLEPLRKSTFNRYMAFSGFLNQASEVEKETVLTSAQNIKSDIEAKGIMTSGFSYKASWLKTSMLFLLYPIYLIGQFLHFIPLKIARAFTNSKVNKAEFYAVILFLSTIILVFLYYLLLFVLFYFLVGFNLAVCLIVAVFIVGNFTMYYKPHWEAFTSFKKIEHSYEELKKNYIHLQSKIA